LSNVTVAWRIDSNGQRRTDASSIAMSAPKQAFPHPTNPTTLVEESA